MNIQWLRIKPLLRELRLINLTLSRIADCLEADLASREIYVAAPKADTRGEPPELFYTDEEADYVREVEDQEARLKGKVVDPAED